MWSRINKKRIENVLCRFENYIGGIRKQLCDFEMTCWALCGVETTQVKLKLLYCGVKVESRFACFYLTRQLEWKLRKFQLAEVVLVVSKPHVFNLTGQLVSTPPECSTLAATDLLRDLLTEILERWNSVLPYQIAAIRHVLDDFGILLRTQQTRGGCDNESSLQHHRGVCESWPEVST